MTNLKEMILKAKEQVIERENSINGKQSAIITLMKELKDLLNSSKAMAKEYEEMGTMLLNMADELNCQAEDVTDWATYDVTLEEDDEEDESEEEEEEEEDYIVECDNCGKQVTIDDIIYDEYGWGFCCDECKEEFHAEDDEEEEDEDINAEEIGS